MKYKLGDLVTCKYLAAGLVGRITQTHYSSWSGRSDYMIVVEHMGNTFSHNYYEEDLELVEVPAAGYMELFI